MVCPVKINSVRPLVRYVDDRQAVIDTHIITRAMLPSDESHRTADKPIAYVMAEITGADGFHDEGCGRLLLKPCGSQMQGGFRFGIDQPQRWWPAGLGDQPRYELTIRIIVGDEVTDEAKLKLGLASVRRGRVLGEHLPPSLLVNGRICEIVEVLTVDRMDENQLLPANGESLLLVRDHYGADLLYEAADLAGIMAVQAVPIDPKGDPTVQVREHVNRLTAHPSLAGYYIGHLGEIKPQVAECLKQLDPTRTVFDSFPLLGEA